MPKFTTANRILLNALIAATMLRLFGLDRLSLWLDEGVTWSNATRPTIADTMFAEANHPPLWWLVTRGWIALFGDSEFSLRLPAAILGIVAVWLAFLLARRLTDPTRSPSRGGFLGVDGGAAPWAALLAATGAFWIEWSQEARMYSALLVETLGLSLLYLRWLDGGRRQTLVAYACLAALALYTHYFAAFFLAGHAVFALLVARRGGASAPGVSPKALLLAQAGAALLFAPWFVHLLQAYSGFAVYAHDPFGRLAHVLWRIGVGPGLVAFDAGRTGTPWPEVVRDNLKIIVPTALAWGIPVAFGVKAIWRDRGARAFVLSCVLVPIALDLAVFPWYPLIEDKYFVFLAPPLWLLAVVGARTAWPLLRPVLVLGLAGLAAAALLAYHLPHVPFVERTLADEHPYGKEQWREAHAWAAERAEKGDVTLLHPRFLNLVWDYYERGASGGAPAPFEDLPSTARVEDSYLLGAYPMRRTVAAVTADDVLAKVPEIATAKRVFLVLAHETTPDHDHYVRVLQEAMVRLSLGATDGRSRFSMDQRSFPRQWGVRVFEFRRE